MPLLNYQGHDTPTSPSKAQRLPDLMRTTDQTLTVAPGFCAAEALYVRPAPVTVTATITHVTQSVFEFKTVEIWVLRGSREESCHSNPRLHKSIKVTMAMREHQYISYPSTRTDHCPT